jgi:hypothetical protein
MRGAKRPMTEHRPFKTKILVRFRKRDDGGLRAFCDEVPGFYLSGSDRRAIMGDVIPALELLVRTNLAISVQVSPLGYGVYQLVEETEDADDFPEAQEYVKEYVIEKLAA